MGTMHGETLFTALIVSVNDEYIFVNYTSVDPKYSFKEPNEGFQRLSVIALAV